MFSQAWSLYWCYLLYSIKSLLIAWFTSSAPNPIIYVSQSSRISWKSGSIDCDLWDIARKRNKFLLFSVVLRILQLLIMLEPLVHQVGFSSKMYLSKWALQAIENWKCHMFEFRLISLDRIASHTHVYIALILILWMYLACYVGKKKNCTYVSIFNLQQRVSNGNKNKRINKNDLCVCECMLPSLSRIVLQLKLI